MAGEKEITLLNNPIAQAEREWLWMIAFRASLGGQIGPFGDVPDFVAVAVSASIANQIKDEAYRKTALTAAAAYIQRAAENPAANVGKESKAA
jgi:hypothetical protein